MLGAIVLTQGIIFYLDDQNSVNPRYEGAGGFGLCFIDSYRFALGDFELTGDENKEYGIIFWLVFVIGTIVSLLIILNMVIAVMGGAFEEVNGNDEAVRYRAKLALFVENYYKFPTLIQEHLKRYKYMISIEIDPINDPVGNVSEMD